MREHVSIGLGNMQEKNNLGNLKTLVRYIKGVGPKKSEYLARVGLNTVEDILYYLPKRYEDRSSVTAIKDLKPGEASTIQGEITTRRVDISGGGDGPHGIHIRRMV
jgi:ATP-dependent DNA helicase RecG